MMKKGKPAKGGTYMTRDMRPGDGDKAAKRPAKAASAAPAGVKRQRHGKSKR